MKRIKKSLIYNTVKADKSELLSHKMRSDMFIMIKEDVVTIKYINIFSTKKDERNTKNKNLYNVVRSFLMCKKYQ